VVLIPAVAAAWAMGRLLVARRVVRAEMTDAGLGDGSC